MRRKASTVMAEFNADFHSNLLFVALVFFFPHQPLSIYSAFCKMQSYLSTRESKPRNTTLLQALCGRFCGAGREGIKCSTSESVLRYSRVAAGVEGCNFHEYLLARQVLSANFEGLWSITYEHVWIKLLLVSVLGLLFMDLWASLRPCKSYRNVTVTENYSSVLPRYKYSHWRTHVLEVCPSNMDFDEDEAQNFVPRRTERRF